MRSRCHRIERPDRQGLLPALAGSGTRRCVLVRRRPGPGAAGWDPSCRGSSTPAPSTEPTPSSIWPEPGSATGAGPRPARRLILGSRVDATASCRTLAGLARAPRRPRRALRPSATTATGADEELTETSRLDTGFQAEVCQAWERPRPRPTRPESGWSICARPSSSPPGAAPSDRQPPLFRAGLGGPARVGEPVVQLDHLGRRGGSHPPCHRGRVAGRSRSTPRPPAPVTNREFTSALGAGLAGLA